jgi:hypothetical protein
MLRVPAGIQIVSFLFKSFNRKLASRPSTTYIGADHLDLSAVSFCARPFIVGRFIQLE